MNISPMNVGQLWQPETPRSVGAILLDADNQMLTVDKEQWIQEVTKTSINYRFAFANWKKCNADVDLWKRGYYLLHAPAGDDMTDGLMIAFASTLPQHYLEIGRVFICSNDHTFDALAATFSKYRVLCYRVTQHGQSLEVQNHQTGENYKYRPLPNEGNKGDTSAKEEEMVGIILGIIRELLCRQGKADGEYVPLNQVGTAYKARYGHGILEGLRRCGLGDNLRAFIAQHSSDFNVKQNGNGQWEVSLLPTIFKEIEMEIEMVDIIRELLRSQGKAAGEYANPSLIAAAYKANYGHSISEGLRRRGLGANWRAFIAQYSSYFAIKSGSNGSWEVAYLSSTVKHSNST